MTVLMEYKFPDTVRMNAFVKEAESMPQISRIQTHPQNAKLQVWVDDNYKLLEALRDLMLLSSKFQGGERGFRDE